MKTSNQQILTTSLATSLIAALMLSVIGGCDAPQPAPTPKTKIAPTANANADEPCTPEGAPKPKVMPAAPGASTPKMPRRMWATSYLYAEAPKLLVEKWLSDKPETKGKYVLIEFWATWCPPCRRSIPLLNKFHKKYGDELVVIGISEESEADVRKLKTPKVEYFSAIDTEMRMKKELGVFGIPHVIILEPGGFVIWEGFPLLKDYELTEKIIDKILAVGRKLKAAKAAEAKK
jgi:cytochrome c biogenesis protein CcmG, thiol:disulfide interchange protein DsbE